MSNYDSVRLPPPPSKNGYRMGGEYLKDMTWGQWTLAGQDFCVPGDVIRCGQNAFVRTIPMVSVPFTSFHIKFVTFFTPIRVLDEDATKIITGFDENDDPFEGSFDSWYISKDADLAKGSYYDQMSFQVVTKDVYDDIPEECKPADYWRKNLYRIYNEWLREPSLQDEVDEDENNDILLANYHRDRYTAALLSPQLGAESYIGIDASNSVTFNGSTDEVLGFISNRYPFELQVDDSSAVSPPNGYKIKYDSGSMRLGVGNINGSNWSQLQRPDLNYVQERMSGVAYAPIAGSSMNGEGLSLSNVPINSVADSTQNFSSGETNNRTLKFSQSNFNNPLGFLPGQDFKSWIDDNTLDINGGIGILDLRAAFANQLLAERMNRTGSRYNEYLRANYGIAPRDETLQRPVFLGSSVAPIMVNEVTQTSESGTTPLGDIAGKGITATSSYTKRYLVKEFGIVQTLMAIVPDVYYTQGIPKKYTYKSKNDFFKTLYQTLGEVEVLNSELFVNGTSHGDDPDEDGDNGTFGFEPIYEELRHPEKRITGAFRDELQNWHLGRKFAERPNLNGEFVQCQSQRDDLNRIFVAFDDTKYKPFHVHVYNDIRALRPIIREPIGASLTGMR